MQRSHSASHHVAHESCFVDARRYQLRPHLGEHLYKSSDVRRRLRLHSDAHASLEGLQAEPGVVSAAADARPRARQARASSGTGRTVQSRQRWRRRDYRGRQAFAYRGRRGRSLVSRHHGSINRRKEIFESSSRREIAKAYCWIKGARDALLRRSNVGVAVECCAADATQLSKRHSRTVHASRRAEGRKVRKLKLAGNDRGGIREQHKKAPVCMGRHGNSSGKHACGLWAKCFEPAITIASLATGAARRKRATMFHSQFTSPFLH